MPEIHDACLPETCEMHSELVGSGFILVFLLTVKSTGGGGE